MTISVIDPTSLAGIAWHHLLRDAKNHNWPAGIESAAWDYLIKLTERSSGKPGLDRTEVDKAAAALNSAEREWKAPIKKVHIARAVRDKVKMTCRRHGISDTSEHKIFTSGILAQSNRSV